MKENNHYIDKIFKDDLKNYKEEPADELWTGIASEIADAGTVGAASTLWKKVILGVTLLSVVVTGVWLSQSGEKNIDQNETKSEIKEGAGKSSDKDNEVASEEIERISDKKKVSDGTVQGDLSVAQEEKVVEQTDVPSDQSLNPLPKSKEPSKVGDKNSVHRGDWQGPGKVLKNQLSFDISRVENLFPLESLAEFIGSVDTLTTDFNYRADTIQQRKRKWFVHTGLGYGNTLGTQSRFRINEDWLSPAFGGGFYLNDQNFLSLTFSNYQWKASYTQLIGESRLKLGIEGAFGLGVDSNFGPSVGAGLFYDLKSGTRLTSMVSYQHSLTGERGKLLSVNTGIQFDLFRQRTNSDAPRRSLLSRESGDRQIWKNWFASTQISASHKTYFGLGIINYFDSSSFFEIGALIHTGPNTGNRTGNDRIRLNSSYNYLIGQRKIKLMMRVGAVYESSLNLLNESRLYYNLGAGGLYDISERVKLFAIPNFNNPFSRISSEGRFSFNIGLQIKIKKKAL